MPRVLLGRSSLLPIGEPLQHDGSVRAVAFSPDGSLAMTGSEDGTARCGIPSRESRLANQCSIAQKPNFRQVLAVAFGRNGTVATGGEDGLARLWQARRRLPGAPLQHQGGVQRCISSGWPGGLDRMLRRHGPVVGTRVARTHWELPSESASRQITPLASARTATRY